MTRSTAAMFIVALLLSAAIGALGGYRYAEHRTGYELLITLQEDAQSNLGRYERMKQLVERNESEKLLRYLDSLMDIESTVLKSTQVAESHATAESDL